MTNLPYNLNNQEGVFSPVVGHFVRKVPFFVPSSLKVESLKEVSLSRGGDLVAR